MKTLIHIIQYGRVKVKPKNPGKTLIF